jgi:hypothetical protein
VTLNKHLSNLIKHKWIGYNAKSGIYFVRGYQFVMKQEGLNGYLTVVLNFEELIRIKAIIGVSIFGLLYRNAKYNKKKEGLGNKGWEGIGRKKSCPNQIPLPSHFQVSINGASSIFNISKNKIFRLKRAAVQAKLLESKPHYKRLDIPKSQWANTIRYNSYHTGKVFNNQNGLFLSLPDLVKPLVVFKRSQRLK